MTYMARLKQIKSGPALPELTEHPSGGFGSADARTFSADFVQAPAHPEDKPSRLQTMEDEALAWLMRFLQYDTVPMDSVEAAARSHGLSWLIVKRVASGHVIEMPARMSRATYWKLPKPLRWQPDDQIP
jgi:hypothetical protein